jgi:hypothetical protein
MFESIVSEINNTVSNVVRAIGAVLNRSPWIVPVALLVVLLFG